MRNIKKTTTSKWKSGKRCSCIEGKACKHPDKVQPSLEAFGFDMVKTAKNVLGLEIKWSKGLLIPKYLTLACGIFSIHKARWNFGLILTFAANSAVRCIGGMMYGERDWDGLNHLLMSILKIVLAACIVVTILVFCNI